MVTAPCSTTVSTLTTPYDLVVTRAAFNPIPWQATQGGLPYRLDTVVLEFVVKAKIITPAPAVPFEPDSDALLYKTVANGGIVYTDTLDGLFTVLIQPGDLPATAQGLSNFPEGDDLYYAIRNLSLSTIMAAGKFTVWTTAAVGG